MFVFSGSSNQKLAKKIAQNLKCKLGKVKLDRFPNGEARVRIKEKTANKTAIIVQSFSLPVDKHIIEFCLLCDALKRLGAKKIIAVIPWLGYSKQDKVFRSGEPLSVKVITQIIQTAPFDKVIIFDLHNQSIIGFFDKPIIQLSTQTLFLDFFKKIIKTDNFMVIAPDAGSIKNSTAFAGKLGLPIAYIDKERDLLTGKVKIHGISKKITDKNLIIVDDMISTGSTLVETAKFLKKQGGKKIYVAATHHLFVPQVQAKLKASPIDKLLISDTIENKSPSSKFLSIVSVAKLIADAIKDKM